MLFLLEESQTLTRLKAAETLGCLRMIPAAAGANLWMRQKSLSGPDARDVLLCLMPNYGALPDAERNKKLDCWKALFAAAGQLDLSDIDLRDTMLWWEWPPIEIYRFMYNSGRQLNQQIGYRYPPELYKRQQLAETFMANFDGKKLSVQLIKDMRASLITETNLPFVLFSIFDKNHYEALSLFNPRRIEQLLDLLRLDAICSGQFALSESSCQSCCFIIFNSQPMEQLCLNALAKSDIDANLVASILVEAANETDSLTFDAILIDLLLQWPHYLNRPDCPIAAIITQRLRSQINTRAQKNHLTDVLLAQSRLISLSI